MNKVIESVIDAYVAKFIDEVKNSQTDLVKDVEFDDIWAKVRRQSINVNSVKKVKIQKKKTVSGYMAFCGEKRDEVANSKEVQKLEKKQRFAAISKKLGQMWKELDDEEKEEYNAIGKEQTEEKKDEKPKERCSATTAKGSSCTKYAIEGTEFCKIHSGEKKEAKQPAEKKTCKGVTKAGNACKKVVTEGFEYCTAHLNQAEESESGSEKETKAEKKKCKGKTVKGADCKRNVSDAEDYCASHKPKDEEPEEATIEEEETTCSYVFSKGKKNKGKRCENKTVKNGMCKIHAK